MSEKTTLTLAFVQQAPGPAAQVLQSLPADEAALLIAAIPARLAAPVVVAMIPWHAARTLEHASASRAAMILRQLAFADSISLVRLVATVHRERIFQELPRRYATRLTRALSYPRHQVGAWIDPDIPTLSTEHSVADAMRLIRAADASSHIFVESPGHAAYVGAISIRDIMRSELSTPLGRLSLTHTKPISNRASLSSIAFDERWDEMLHLPVIGRRGNLLGGLARRSLRSAVHSQHVAQRRSDPAILSELLGAMFTMCSGLGRLVSGADHDTLLRSAKEVSNER